MDHYKIIVRDDDYEEAFLCVGRYLKQLSEKNQQITIVKEDEPVYIVTMSGSIVETVRKHGDVVDVVGML